MEEAWELAVVSEYKKRHEDDWSGRHVRIRFEMIISALVFFIIARYEANEIRLPLIGLKSDITDDFLLYGALVFCIFAMVSLLARSHYEKMRWPKEELSSLKEVKILQSDFDAIYSSAKALPFSSKDAPKETFDKTGVSRDDIISLNTQSNRFLQFLSDLNHENGMNSPVHPKFWAKVVPLMASVNSAANSILNRSNAIHGSQGSVLAMGTAYQTVHNEISAQYAKMLDNLNALEPEISQRRKALKKLAITKFFQREILSYGLPITTAIGLLLFGLASKFCGCS